MTAANTEIKSVSIKKVENGYLVSPAYGAVGSPAMAPSFSGNKEFVFTTWTEVDTFLTDSEFTAAPAAEETP